MTTETFSKILAQVDELKKEGLSGAKIGARIAPEYSEFRHGTILTYVRACLKLSKEAIKFYLDGDISLTVLMEFGQSQMSTAEIDFYLMEFIAEGMSYADAVAIKADHLKGMSAGENVMRRTGRISSSPYAKPFARLKKEFDDLFGESQELLREAHFKAYRVVKLIASGNLPANLAELVKETEKAIDDARASSQLAVDLLPVSVLDIGHIHSEFFRKAYFLRDSVMEPLKYLRENPKTFPEYERLEFALAKQFGYLDRRVRDYLDQIDKFMSSEAWIEKRRKEQDNG